MASSVHITIFRLLLPSAMFLTNLVRADFGLPVTLGGSTINTYARGINTALDTLERNVRRYNSIGQTNELQLTREVIDSITYNITSLGKQLTANVITVAYDKSTPAEELFKMLQKSYGEMNHYLGSDVRVLVDNLNSTLGVVYASEFTRSLDSLNGALMNVTNVTADLGVAIGKTFQAANGESPTKSMISENIPSDLTSSLSKALVQMRDQTVVLSKIIENTLRNVGYINSYLAKASTTGQSVEQKLNSSLAVMRSQFLSGQENALKKYFAQQTAIKSDISAAIGKLSLFNPSRTLLNLTDRHAEEYTKIYYFLYNRNETDVVSIVNSYEAIISNLKGLIQKSNEAVSSQLQQIAAKLADLYLGRGDNADYCYKKYSEQVFNSYSNFDRTIQNCMGREKTRISRINEAMEKILQLISTNSQDFAENIASCSYYSGFASSETTFMQAKTCLTSNLDHMSDFQAVVDQQFGAIERILSIEVAASRFRLSDCIAARANEASALNDGLNASINLCTSLENPRAIEQEGADLSVELTDEPPTTDVDEYDQYI